MGNSNFHPDDKISHHMWCYTGAVQAADNSGEGVQVRGPACGQQGVWSLRHPPLPSFPPPVPPSLLGAGAVQVLGLAGAEVKLECQTSGVPTPQVEWTKDGQ